MAHECCCCIDLEIEESALSLEVTETALTWGTDEYVRVVTADAEEYEGAYSAIPSWQAQTFATANRVMREDFAVSQIVKLEAPNESGGLTLTI